MTDLIRNHRKAPSCIPRSCGLNGGIEREEVGLVGYALDHAGGLSYLGGAVPDPVYAGKDLSKCRFAFLGYRVEPVEHTVSFLARKRYLAACLGKVIGGLGVLLGYPLQSLYLVHGALHVGSLAGCQLGHVIDRLGDLGHIVHY